MCTAVFYRGKAPYFGRNLDFTFSYGENVVITPAAYPFSFLEGKCMERHYAMIGMACVMDAYPLYYDAVNEKGLAMAGLLFQENAVYGKPVRGKDAIPSWALLPWVLGQCETVEEAERLLLRLSITDEPFSETLPPSPLHWMIADKERALVLEATKDGLRIYENPIGVLTNNPPFPFHQENLRQYLHLTAAQAENRFSKRVPLTPFSFGMGAFGLPGDWSSASRFIRAAFVKENAPAEGDVVQFFHILGAVEMPAGAVRWQDGSVEKTIYSACCDLERQIYYYRTYTQGQIAAVELNGQPLDGNRLITYPVKTDVDAEKTFDKRHQK